MPKNNNDEMSGLEEARSTFIKWGKEGDFVKGTLTARRQVPDQLKRSTGKDPNALQWIYELQVLAGRFHDIVKKKVNENPTTLEAGSFISVGGKPGIDNGMRNAKLGQIVGFRFEETKPSKNPAFNDNKIVKVYLGEMDRNYMGQSSSDVEQAVVDSGI